MTLEDTTRRRLREVIASKLEAAAGTSVTDHGINRWDTAAETIISAVEEIIEAHQSEPRPEDARS